MSDENLCVREGHKFHTNFLHYNYSPRLLVSLLVKTLKMFYNRHKTGNAFQQNYFKLRPIIRENWQTNRTTETFLTRTIIWFWVTTKRITLKIFFSIYYKFKKIRISLTLYILTSVCRFSIPFSKQFLRCWRGEFDYRSREYLVGDHFLYSHDLTM